MDTIQTRFRIEYRLASTLEMGDKIWVDPNYFKNPKSEDARWVRQKNKTKEAFVVSKVYRSSDQKVLALELSHSGQTRRLEMSEIDSSLRYGARFLSYLDLDTGDYVKFKPSSQQKVFVDVESGELLDLSEHNFPMIGTIAQAKKGASEVVIQLAPYPLRRNSSEFYGWRVKVSLKDLTPMAGRDASHAFMFYDALATEPLEFTKNELVRYRNSIGAMDVGYFESENEKFIFLTNGQAVRKNQVFKVPREVISTSSPNSKELARYGIYSLGYGTVDHAYFSAIARMTSTKDFMSLNQLQQVDFLNKWVFSTIQYDTDIAVDNVFLDFLSDSICSRNGVCRHQARILHIALSETGIQSSLEKTVGTKERPGHAWVKVVLGGQNYYVDPAAKKLISEEDAKLRAIANPQSTEAMFYLSKNKKVVEDL